MTANLEAGTYGREFAGEVRTGKLVLCREVQGMIDVIVQFHYITISLYDYITISLYIYMTI